jgi:hypothetical protein
VHEWVIPGAGRERGWAVGMTETVVVVVVVVGVGGGDGSD